MLVFEGSATIGLPAALKSSHTTKSCFFHNKTTSVAIYVSKMAVTNVSFFPFILNRTLLMSQVYFFFRNFDFDLT